MVPGWDNKAEQPVTSVTKRRFLVTHAEHKDSALRHIHTKKETTETLIFPVRTPWPHAVRLITKAPTHSSSTSDHSRVPTRSPAGRTRIVANRSRAPHTAESRSRGSLAGNTCSPGIEATLHSRTSCLERILYEWWRHTPMAFLSTLRCLRRRAWENTENYVLDADPFRRLKNFFDYCLHT